MHAFPLERPAAYLNRYTSNGNFKLLLSLSNRMQVHGADQLIFLWDTNRVIWPSFSRLIGRCKFCYVFDHIKTCPTFPKLFSGSVQSNAINCYSDIIHHVINRLYIQRHFNTRELTSTVYLAVFQLNCQNRNSC